MRRWALRIALWLDRSRELPDETRALDAGLQLFDVDRFNDGQLDVVLGALRGESLLVIRPTGAGKSLCFQLPAVLKGQPATIVLSPLKALMVDQVAGLQRRKLPATFINADVSREEKQGRFDLLEAGALSLLYLAPERFNPERVRAEEIARLTRQRPSFLVVDEAHLVDRWGDDFRTDYSRIAEVRRQLGSPPVLAFTATAGARTQERIKHSLGIPEARTLVSGVDRPNIALMRLQEGDVAARAQIVADLIRRLPSGRVMVFVPTVNVGRTVQEALRAAGCPLPLYHAKLPVAEREHLLGRFTGSLEPQLTAVICTSAFSMGLDVSDVRAVVNWQHPSAVEDYLQEFGRAGRDGEPALALLFRDGGREAGLLRWMAEKTSDEVVAQGKRTHEEAQVTLRGRLERIQEMARIASRADRCFRAQLNEALLGPEVRERRSWALRVLDWALARRARARTGDACCDICNPEIAERLRQGAYAPLAEGVHPSRTSAAPSASALDDRRRRRLPRLRVVVAGIAAALALVGGASWALTSDSSRAGGDAASVAREAFRRYTGGFADDGEFTAPTMAADRSAVRTCADHAYDGRADPGRYRLCIIVDPARPAGRRVTGGFKISAERGRYACYGSADTAGYCD